MTKIEEEGRDAARDQSAGIGAQSGDTKARDLYTRSLPLQTEAMLAKDGSDVAEAGEPTMREDGRWRIGEHALGDAADVGERDGVDLAAHLLVRLATAELQDLPTEVFDLHLPVLERE